MSSNRPLNSLFALLGALLFGCGDAGPGPNVFFVVLDATSAAYLSPYGAPEVRTPQIARLAKDSVVFENAYAQTPATITSTASLLTGVRATTHRMQPSKRLSARFQVLPEVLRGAGYRTFGIVANPFGGAPRFGFDRGYDQLIEVYKLDLVRGNPAGASKHYAAATPENVNAALLPLLADLPERGNFFYVHYLYPHTPYDAPRHYDEDASAEALPNWDELRLLLSESGGRNLPPEATALLERAYRANLRWADAGLGVLLDALQETGLYEESMIVLFADHGEAFGAHGFVGHNATLYDDMLRIPLLWKFPRSDGTKPRRVEVLAETVDLMPTLLDYLGVRSPEQLEGDSLLAAARGRREPHPDSEVVATTGDQLQHAIRVGRHKLILDASGEPRLYDLENDPDERHNLAPAQPALVAKLGAKLVRFVAAPAPAPDSSADVPPEDPALWRLLEELGYAQPEVD